MLNTITHGDSRVGQPPLVIAHGLFGSARNWTAIARGLADEREVVAVDLRNHGHSPWTDSHGYEDLAADLAEVIETRGGRADVLGHSMGGKAAMTLALLFPERVERLIVADIAPVAYTHSQMPYVRAMRGVDLQKVHKRSEAAEQLAGFGVEPALQSFFTQSLDLREQRWLLNLATIASEMPKIMGFPDIATSWPGRALFLTGAQSDYVRPEHREAIAALFPGARFVRLKGAGHWLHADQPQAFSSAVRGFLSR